MLKVKYFKSTNYEVKNYLDLVKSWNEIFSLNYLNLKKSIQVRCIIYDDYNKTNWIHNKLDKQT